MGEMPNTNTTGQAQDTVPETPATTETVDRAAETMVDFETWLQQQSEEVRAAYEQHVARLKGALRSERETRSQLEKQLKRILKGEEVPDSVRSQIEQATQQLRDLELRAEFISEAAKRQVLYPDLLFRAAKEQLQNTEDLNNDLLWERLRREYPALFRPAAATRSAEDAGARGETPQLPSVDDYIREMARR